MLSNYKCLFKAKNALFLHIVKHHVIKLYGERQYNYSLFKSSLFGSKWSVALHDRFKFHDTHWLGAGWSQIRSACSREENSLDSEEKRTFIFGRPFWQLSHTGALKSTNYDTFLELFTGRDHKTAEFYVTIINDIKGHAFVDLDWIYLMAQGSMLHYFFYRSYKYSDVKNISSIYFQICPTLIISYQLYSFIRLRETAHFVTRVYVWIGNTQTYILQSIINPSFIPIRILNCTCEMPSTYSQQVTSQEFEEEEKKIKYGV